MIMKKRPFLNPKNTSTKGRLWSWKTFKNAPFWLFTEEADFVSESFTKISFNAIKFCCIYSFAVAWNGCTLWPWAPTLERRRPLFWPAWPPGENTWARWETPFCLFCALRFPTEDLLVVGWIGDTPTVEEYNRWLYYGNICGGKNACLPVSPSPSLPLLPSLTFLDHVGCHCQIDGWDSFLIFYSKFHVGVVLCGSGDSFLRIGIQHRHRHTKVVRVFLLAIHSHIYY